MHKFIDRQAKTQDTHIHSNENEEKVVTLINSLQNQIRLIISLQNYFLNRNDSTMHTKQNDAYLSPY